MNATLELQISIARTALGEASAQNLLDRAKFALGLLAGAVGAAVAEEDQHVIFRIATEASYESSVDAVIDAAVAIQRYAYELI